MKNPQAIWPLIAYNLVILIPYYEGISTCASFILEDFG